MWVRTSGHMGEIESSFPQAGHGTPQIREADARRDSWRDISDRDVEENVPLGRVKRALEFYARHEHWMGHTEDDDLRRVLSAMQGDGKQDGWHVAESVQNDLWAVEQLIEQLSQTKAEALLTINRMNQEKDYTLDHPALSNTDFHQFNVPGYNRGLSWDGNDIRGHDKSIEAVNALIHQAGLVPELKREILSLRKTIAARSDPGAGAEPLREGYVRKGGINPGCSQIVERPPAPPPLKPVSSEANKIP